MNINRYLIFLRFVVLFLLVFFDSTASRGNPYPLSEANSVKIFQTPFLRNDIYSPCLPLFSTNPWLFNRFRKQGNKQADLLFLFIRERPFIEVEKNLSLDTQTKLQTPFRCFNTTQRPKAAQGFAFDILEVLHENNNDLSPTWCVWAGSERHCPFNALVGFVEQQSRNGYAFAITGLLLDMPERRRIGHMSAPVVIDSAAVMGLRDKSVHTMPDTIFKQLVAPFHWSAWVTFLVFLTVMFIVCCVIIWFLRPDVRGPFGVFTYALLALIGHDDDFRGTGNTNLEDLDGEDSSTHTVIVARRRITPVLFKTSLVSLVFITGLAYELGVVNYLFQAYESKLQTPVTGLRPSDLQKFCVLNNSALEQVLNRTLVGRWKRTWDWEKSVPWTQCQNFDHCLDLVKDKTNKVEYMFTMNSVGRYLLQQTDNCDNLDIFQTSDVLYNFNGGFFFGSNVSSKSRSDINGAIVELRLNGKLQKELDVYIRKDPCRRESPPEQFTFGYFIIPYIVLVATPFLVGSAIAGFEIVRFRQNQ